MPTGVYRQRDQQLLGGLRLLATTIREYGGSYILILCEGCLLVFLLVAYIASSEVLRGDAPMAVAARKMYYQRIFGANKLALQGRRVSPADDDLESTVSSIFESLSRRSLFSVMSTNPGGRMEDDG